MKIKIPNSLSFLFLGMVFMLTRQVPFIEYNVITNVLLVLLFFVYFIRYPSNNCITAFMFVFAWMLLLVLSSISEGNNIALGLRFAFIILLLVLSHYIILNKDIVRCFWIIISIQVLFIIIMEFYLNFYYDINTYAVIRNFVKSNKWGDIYTYNGFYYRIQVAGNPILVFAFMISFLEEFKIKYIKLCRVLLLFSIFLAGNFAYLVAVCFFGIGWLLFNNLSGLKAFFNRLLVMILLFIISIIPFYGYVVNTIERKDHSLGTREDQFFVLLNDLQTSVHTLFLGRGLGHTLDKVTEFRDYTGDIYFELQGMYFINQLGIVNTSLFLIILIYLMLSKIKFIDLIFIYFCYIIYAVTNPYMLDTTHIFVIIVLCSVKFWRNHEKNRLCNCSL